MNIKQRITQYRMAWMMFYLNCALCGVNIGAVIGYIRWQEWHWVLVFVIISAYWFYASKKQYRRVRRYKQNLVGLGQLK